MKNQKQNMFKKMKNQKQKETRIQLIQKPKNDLKIKVVKQVTIDFLRWRLDEERFLRFESEIKQREGSVETNKRGKKMDPPYLCIVTDLETDIRHNVTCGKVLRERLDITYPKLGYIGKCFSVTKYEVQGKDWNGYRIVEISVG
jgi:hypothetical protein